MKSPSNLRALLGAAALALAACSGKSAGFTPPAQPTAAPLPAIRHVVILVQENRSFNSMFVGFKGALTVTEGACKPVPSLKLCMDPSKPVPLHAIRLQSCRPKCLTGTDIGHDHRTFEIEYNHGKMNGFDDIDFGTGGVGGPASFYPYAYVERSQTKPYWDMAGQYALADHMFSTATTDSYVAHQQLIAGSTQISPTESITNTPSAFPWGCDAPPLTTTDLIKTNGVVYPGAGPFPCFTQYKTMADVLDAANVSWSYYVDSFEGNDPDFSGLVWNAFDPIKHVRYGPDWTKHVLSPNTRVFSDVKGDLPAVSWVVPSLADSDHPAAGSDTGPSWVSSVVNAIGESKYWNSTAIVVLWDDWGGFYDSVPPAQINYTSLGMRVPMIVISPWAKHGYVSHTVYDFGSILKFVEENFGAGSLGTADAAANSMGDVFDFTQTPPPFKRIAAPYSQQYLTQHRASLPYDLIIKEDGGVPE